MWQHSSELLDRGDVRRYTLRSAASPLTCRKVLELWREDEGFRSYFVSLLASDAFSAFRWEMPPISSANVDRPFEFVLIDTPGLERPPDTEAFAPQFRDANDAQAALALPNLGRDATLVVPRPKLPGDAYVHLASFVRRAPRDEVHAFWQLVGATVKQELSSRPLWLSTAGMGVAWLHARIDTRPKYVRHQPYRDERPT